MDSHFNWAFVIKHAVNLGLLMGLLIYLIRKPFLSFLKNRKERLRSEVDRAAAAAEQAKATLEEYSAKLDVVASEVAALQENIRKQGETERDELVSAAEKSCEMIKKEVEDTIRLETTKAVSEIQSEVVDSALVLAEKMIRERVDADFTTDSVDDFVKMIEEGKWQQLRH
ncbi:MAG: ATP synthase F0 subunit B [Candidatus Dadabacteria bacterium]|nr:ATP synthase F0 subunit B [Candidatus Dadabacteria bacterium]MYA48421.1 ATP synthase F0 subunit B [Candidatus Dadabacteria bacterium]MYF48290.1 ATP synthase F0 subunit B [Candidatus Dadabacteria bacterium]MYG82280.1 ATP synthase F0 subunit B [Candidatus Dadabacteria bacterium]MYK48928.1 ATP synthase F0 subunit B [Candidatus Dadabacteria bacterium]